MLEFFGLHILLFRPHAAVHICFLAIMLYAIIIPKVQTPIFRFMMFNYIARIGNLLNYHYTNMFRRSFLFILFKRLPLIINAFTYNVCFFRVFCLWAELANCYITLNICV